jgi:hypothetical protein
MDKLTTIAIMAAIIVAGADDNQRACGYTLAEAVIIARSIYHHSEVYMGEPFEPAEPAAEVKRAISNRWP